jgi:hypothetical protein
MCVYAVEKETRQDAEDKVSIYVHVCMCVCVCAVGKEEWQDSEDKVFLYVCLFVYMHTCTRTYIHTYIQVSRLKAIIEEHVKRISHFEKDAYTCMHVYIHTYMFWGSKPSLKSRLRG